MTAATRDALIRDAINADAVFAARFIRSLREARSVAPTALFCMFAYLSLFAYESHARLKKLDPSAISDLTFTAGATDLIARSRHSLKLFEDTRRGVLGQLKFFADEVAPAHHRAFIKPVRLPLASLWKADVGLTFHNGNLINSTFATTFALGYPPARLFLDGTGETLNKIAQEYGAYFGSIVTVPHPGARSFASAMDPSDLDSRDVRSATWFRHGFNGNATPAINMLLSTFHGLANTCNQLLGLDTTNASRPTIFKLRYLTVYQILRSLTILTNEHANCLTDRSRTHIDKLMTDPEAIRLIDPARKPLRNTLMHYGPDTRIDLSQLALNRPLYGLIEEVFQLSFDEMEQRLAKLTSRVADELNQWSKR
ncbi:hypothetical protein ACH47B_38665 [Rhodococcus sp. NPDC019627]|uniref:hypothetical protein n=1 Tax=unclassified Rhodococcus (in: high G+C Gram-positive bacteria) TaxID=192944 RepID=UPI0033D4125C